MSYDIIGDIHGYADKLRALLRKMGYAEKGGVWRHPSRQAIFVGDFIDRGPEQLESVRIPRAMIDAGAARAVLGNHELNAIAYALKDPETGEYLRRHSDNNLKQHRAFLEAVEGRSDLYRELIDWFLTLPLWLDLGEIRVVHACWHPRFKDYIEPKLVNRALTPELMPEASRKPANKADLFTPEPGVYKAVEALTKGLETPLPEGYSFLDAQGHERREIRVRWWSPQATSYRETALLGSEHSSTLPEDPVPSHVLLGYDGPPLFIGHYWLTGTPAPQTPKLACVDYSAGRGLELCAYRWDGEQEILSENFVTT